MTTFKKFLFLGCLSFGVLHIIRYLFYEVDWVSAFLGFVSMSLISISLYFSKDNK